MFWFGLLFGVILGTFLAVAILAFLIGAGDRKIAKSIRDSRRDYLRSMS